LYNAAFALVNSIKKTTLFRCTFSTHLKLTSSRRLQVLDVMTLEHESDLPEPPKGLEGESVEKDRSDHYTIKVSNARGYLCHIQLEVSECTLPILCSFLPASLHFRSL
jgi:plasmid maintenance system killer protein